MGHAVTAATTRQRPPPGVLWRERRAISLGLSHSLRTLGARWSKDQPAGCLVRHVLVTRTPSKDDVA
jgi:hypothetical protein